MRYEHEDLDEFMRHLKADKEAAKIGMRVLHESKESPPVMVEGQRVGANTVTAVIVLSAGTDEKQYTYTEVVASDTIFNQEQLEGMNNSIKKRTDQIVDQIQQELPKHMIFRGSITWSGKQ